MRSAVVAVGVGLALFGAGLWGAGPPAVASRQVARLEVVGSGRWLAPVEAHFYQIVVRNRGDTAAAPFSVVLTGTDCSGPRGTPESFELRQAADGLAPADDAGFLWRSVLGCRDYAVTVAGSAPRPVSFTSTGYPAAAYVDDASRFGDASNWSPPWGGSEDGGFFGPFSFTSGAASATTAQAGVVWSLHNPTGPHRLYAWIPRHGPLNGTSKPDTPQAAYRWRNPGGPWQSLAVVDQERFGDRFVDLGRADLAAEAQVFLGDHVGAPADAAVWVLFDAVVAVPE